MPYELTYDNPNLETIVSENPSLLNNPNLMPLLKNIEQLIPIDCRGNFYRNLKTIKIDNSQVLNEAGDYNLQDNVIKISSDFENQLKKAFKTDTLEPSMVEYHLNATIFHELLHMASSTYDEETESVYNGLDVNVPGTRIVDGNRGLNEGVTEALTQLYYPEIIKRTGYLEEIALSSHLMSIVGSDKVLKQYFSANGIKPIKEELIELGIEQNEVNALFNQIEVNYVSKGIREEGLHLSSLANIEKIMLKSSIARLTQEINAGRIISEEELNNYFNTMIEPNLITNDNLAFFGHSLNHCLDMESVGIQLQHAKSDSLKYFQTMLETDPYLSYRNSMNKAYLEEGIVSSEFSFSEDNKNCYHKLENINEQKEKLLLQERIFEYSDEFRTRMFEPSIVDYAQRSPLLSAGVIQTKQPNNSTLKAISQNDNILAVNNIKPEYATYLQTNIQQIQPTVFNQQQVEMAQSHSMAQGGMQLTSTMGGFVNVLGLSMLVGFITGLGVWVAFMLIK